MNNFEINKKFFNVSTEEFKEICERSKDCNAIKDLKEIKTKNALRDYLKDHPTLKPDARISDEEFIDILFKKLNQ